MYNNSLIHDKISLQHELHRVNLTYHTLFIYTTQFALRAHALLTLFSCHFQQQQQQHNLYLHDYNYVVTVLQKL